MNTNNITTNLHNVKQSPDASGLDALGISQKAPITEYQTLKKEHSWNLAELEKRAERFGCIYGAPLICIPSDPFSGRKGSLFRGSCNHWDCPRCGLMRAKEEYARIVEGCRQISLEGSLWFMTITCRGNVSSERAEEKYLENTNRLLSTLRANASKTSQDWRYASVVERQRRKHPHTHFLITYAPLDAFEIKTDYSRYVRETEKLNAWLRRTGHEDMCFTPATEASKRVQRGDGFSLYLSQCAVRAGLGVQTSISPVRHVKSVALYIAKYLFKSALDTRWPEHWRRIRYSNSWPKLAKDEALGAFAVIGQEGWNKVAHSGAILAEDANTHFLAIIHACYNVTAGYEGVADFENMIAPVPNRVTKWRSEHGHQVQ